MEKTKASPPATFTVAQVAESLQITETSALKLIHEKKLKAFRAGKLWRISEADLQYFMEGASA